MSDVYDCRDNDDLTNDEHFDNFKIAGLPGETTQRSYCVAQLQSESGEPEQIFTRPNASGVFTSERICDDFAKYYKDNKQSGKTLIVYTNYSPTWRCPEVWMDLQEKYDIEIEMRAASPYARGESEVKEMLRSNKHIRLNAFRPNDWQVVANMIKEPHIPPSAERLAADAKAQAVFNSWRN
ncbi:uncharacterized protein [Watersipora subatra]|uniref:uncharacterized protein n=1 Tax=Watersipora subatra TaxID=2589382 RepID=UPI00355C726B